MNPFSARAANLAQLILNAAERSPRAVFGTDTVSAPLHLVVDTARRLAGEMAALGVRQGQIAAFVGVTSEHYLVMWMAAQLMGVRTALINPHYPSDLLGEMLSDLCPDAVICFDDSPEAMGALGWPVLDARNAWRGSIVLASGRLSALPTDAGEAADWGLSREEAEIACYMHTSGTTGRPKFCGQSHAYFIKLGRYIADSMGYTRFDTVYAPLPMFHINPLGYGVVAGLTAGASVLGTRRFSAGSFWGTVKGIGATAVVLHGAPMKMLLKDTRPEDSAGHSIRTVFFASAEFLARFDIPIGSSVYGSTEAGGLCHFWHVRAGDRELTVEGPTHYAGKSRFDVEAMLSGDGEILVRERSPNTLFSGYLRNGALDASTDADGWFHTGDRGRMDEFGNLVFVERLSESIRVNGEYVPIEYVERVLESHAGLSDFAIWSRPDAVSGQRVVLWLTDLAPDIQRIASAIATLPKIMRPVEIIGIEQLPRDSGVSKVQRRRLASEPVLWRRAVSVA